MFLYMEMLRLRHGGTQFVVVVLVMHLWHPRSDDRLADDVWNATVHRVRGEFDEMPCLRVTVEQARLLFGLADPYSRSILDHLAAEGFLVRTEQGEYVRNR